MNNENIQQALHTFKIPTYDEIPDVGLYLDQVTKYINGFFLDFPSMEVTPSMISNYVKLKLIPRVNKKTYSRDQIAGFIFIVLAKTVLSMNNIQRLLDLQQSTFTTQVGYTYFRDELMQVLSSFYSPDEQQKTKEKMSEEKRMLHNVVITIVNKMYLDRYFAEMELLDQQSHA